jgi:hypothetical protein
MWGVKGELFVALKAAGGPASRSQTIDPVRSYLVRANQVNKKSFAASASMATGEPGAEFFAEM